MSKKLYPPSEILKMIRQKSSKIKIYNNPQVAIKNADAVLTDKVISMNDKVNKKKKSKIF